MGMKRYCCLKCKNISVIYSRPNNSKYNRDPKPFRCMRCDKRFSYEQIGAKINKKGGYVVKNIEKVKKLSKALFNHCAKLMSEKRKAMEE